MKRGQEHLYERQTESEIVWADLAVTFQYLKRAYKKDGERISSRSCCHRIMSNVFNLEDVRFRLDIKKKFFTVRIRKHWTRLPREVVNAPIPINIADQAG